MVYIYKKKIGNKEYYYLRASVRNGSKIITKDIAYLGNDPNKIKNKLKTLPSKYSEQIRKTYKTIKKFTEVNYYLNKIKELKLKKNEYMSNDLFLNLESCKLHWNTKIKKLDKLTKEELMKNFIVEFSFNTTSLEGNTITLKEAYNLLIENKTPKSKVLREVYDIQNTESVFNHIMSENKLTHKFICNIHDTLLENIDERKGYRYLDIRVFKSNFKSTPGEYVKEDMELLIKWYNKHENKVHPLILATIFHHKFEKIHPFMDGNGRTGRMLLNFILINKGFPPLLIRKTNRPKYLIVLGKADKSNINESKIIDYKPLIEFIASEYIYNYWNNFLV